MSRAPFVAMLTDLRKEDRIELISDVTGFNRDEVIGKLFRLWAWCTDRGLEDAPDDCEGYAVPERVVRQFLGPRGLEALLGDGCDELAMGVRRDDGLIYLRGTHETVFRLRSLRSTAVTGGRSASRGNGRDVGGRFVRNQQIIQPTVQPGASSGPAENHPAPSREPAASSEIPQSTEEKISPSRAIPPSTEHSATPTPVPVHQEIWSELEQARSRVAAAIGSTVHQLPVFDPGRTHLALMLKGSIAAAAQARHAIAIAALEDRKSVV